MRLHAFLHGDIVEHSPIIQTEWDLPNASDLFALFIVLRKRKHTSLNEGASERTRSVLFMLEIESNRFSMLLHRCYTSVILFYVHVLSLLFMFRVRERVDLCDSVFFLQPKPL